MKISFSNEVRKEICSSVNDKEKRFACLYGMLLFSRELSAGSVCFQSESGSSSQLFAELCRRVFRTEPACKTNTRRNGTVLYSYEITDPELISEIYSRYRIDPEEREINSEIIATNSLGVFTAGAFLACGSVNDPEKEYHLEFAVPDDKLASELKALLGDIGVNAKTSLRRGQHIVYIKGSESIEDTLTFIGAQQCTLDLMNVKIYKDVRNKANRIANCDSANIDKVVNAAVKQLEDIKLIDRTLGLDNISEELRNIAQLRLDNLDMSLREIGDTLEPPISRSGVNHRFKRLAKIADDIREGRTDDKSE